MTPKEFGQREDVRFHRAKAALARRNYKISEENYHTGRLIQLYEKYVKGKKR